MVRGALRFIKAPRPLILVRGALDAAPETAPDTARDIARDNGSAVDQLQRSDLLQRSDQLTTSNFKRFRMYLISQSASRSDQLNTSLHVRSCCSPAARLLRSYCVQAGRFEGFEQFQKQGSKQPQVSSQL